MCIRDSGNPDTATNIAVCVPGLESRVSKMDQIGGDAYALYRESLAADPAHQTAVIAWQGYDAPEFSNVMFQDHADAGARLLAADVAAPVSYTHLDVYKRQLPGRLVRCDPCGRQCPRLFRPRGE